MTAWIKGARGLRLDSRKHPDMIPDLRAYVVLCAGDDRWRAQEALSMRPGAIAAKLSDEGLALVGLALDAAGDGRAKDAATLLEKKAQSDANRCALGRQLRWAARVLGRHFERRLRRSR